ncbi:hypothetical protein LDR16_001109 [Salmonella enterica]|nr:hypothetical protein [Salmonella enterica]EIE5967836.1 hypothetical protein [Salmonella enterica]
MNAFTVTQSGLLLTGAIVLAAVIVGLLMAFGEYRYKHRQRNRINIEWYEVTVTAYGNVKRSDYQKIATGNYKQL